MAKCCICGREVRTTDDGIVATGIKEVDSDGCHK